MRLNEISDNPGARQARKRVGRGIGSGLGKTSGAGVKGQKSRTGVAIKGFEGGQMPLHRRLPKRGFTNPSRARYVEVTTGRLQQAVDGGKLDVGATVNADALTAAGVIKTARDGVRLLVKGALTAKLTVEVAGASKAAVSAVEQAGGSVVQTAVLAAAAAAVKRETKGRAAKRKAASAKAAKGGASASESQPQP